MTDVLGHGVGSESEQRFLPLYATFAASQEREHHAAFTTRREPRLLSSAQKRHGPRTSYIGTEVFLSLVDSARAPFSRDLRQLSVETLCSNRDLPLLMPVGGGTTDLALEIAAPVQSVRVISGPSRPYAPLADGAVAWRAISHLSLNYFSLANAASDEGAAALRELLALYAPGGRHDRAPADRRDPVGDREACRAPPPGARARWRSAAASRWRSRWTTWRSREPAPAPSARSSSSSSRGTSRSTRSPRPCCGPAAGMRSTDGCHAGARGRRCRVPRGVGRVAVPLRLLPDDAPAGVPVGRPAEVGDGASSGGRTGAARPGPRPVVRADGDRGVRRGRRTGRGRG